MKRSTRLNAIGIALTLACGALWHGPLGAGDRLAAHVEADARTTLVHYEMGGVSAHMERAPLRRRLLMAGPADDFQRAELVRLMEQLPGVTEARWSTRHEGPMLPLLVEAELLALAGFCFGLMLAYLVELRRRSHRWDRI